MCFTEDLTSIWPPHGAQYPRRSAVSPPVSLQSQEENTSPAAFSWLSGGLRGWLSGGLQGACLQGTFCFCALKNAPSSDSYVSYSELLSVSLSRSLWEPFLAQPMRKADVDPEGRDSQAKTCKMRRCHLSRWRSRSWCQDGRHRDWSSKRRTQAACEVQVG